VRSASDLRRPTHFDAERTCRADLIHTATPDTRRSCLCRVWSELDDCSERVQTSDFLSATVLRLSGIQITPLTDFLSATVLRLSGIQITPPKRTQHRQDSYVVSGVVGSKSGPTRLALRQHRVNHDFAIVYVKYIIMLELSLFSVPSRISVNTVFHSNSVKCLFSHLLQYSVISIFSGHASCVLTSQFTPQPPLVCGRVYVTVQSPSVPAINRCSSVRRVCCRRPSGQDIDRLLHDQQQRRCSSNGAQQQRPAVLRLWPP